VVQRKVYALSAMAHVEAGKSVVHFDIRTRCELWRLITSGLGPCGALRTQYCVQPSDQDGTPGLGNAAKARATVSSSI
jgi:hypothetical protein